MKPFILLLLCLSVSSMAAGLQELADFGGRDFINPKTSHINKRHVASLNEYFPVRTETMRPGKINNGRAPLPNVSATAHPTFFVMGYDKFSVQWANQNKAVLLETKAHGLVVDVESLQQLNYLKSILKPLPLVAVNGSSLSSFWGINHYPFLVKQGVITQ